MAQENSSHVAICDKCKGNGFIRISKDSFSKVKQCKHCNSEGVMRIGEPAIEELEQMADIARLQ
jgi:DnaJ-class molecular chaperone|tara:strand:- start:124 stop:315 length:192 start_codon:yes stop_codon:yes gene_type:complete